MTCTVDRLGSPVRTLVGLCALRYFHGRTCRDGFINWDAIGSIGEIVGAIAVVATLGYLASQVRHAKEAAADSSRLNRGVGIRDLLGRMADDGVREAWMKAEGTEEAFARIADAFGLTLQEAGKIEHICQGWFWRHWSHWASTKTHRDVEELEHIVSAFYSVPPMSTVWKLSPHVQLLRPEFIQFVDSAVAQARPRNPVDGEDRMRSWA